MAKYREIAEGIFNEWSERGFLETSWMNPEDKEVFIGPMTVAIERAVNDALDDYDMEQDASR